MIFAKQSTAVTLLIGPFLDDTDGKTAETGLTISQADVRLSKNGGNMAQKNESTSCTHDELGYYTCPLDATDTGTLGVLKLMVHVSGALPVWCEVEVLPANVYDSMVLGTDYIQADAVQIEGSDATDQINAACDSALTDYDGPTNAEMVARTLAAADYATAAGQTALSDAISIIDGIVDSILEDTGTTLPTTLSTFDPDADVLENGKTFSEMWRVMKAVLAGKTTNYGLRFRDDADTKNRLVVTTDVDFNRTVVSEDGT